MSHQNTTATPTADQPDQISAPSQNQTYSAKQVAQQLGITSRQIRSYCALGIIPNLKRSLTGYYTFTESQINQLQVIANLRRCELKNHEIKTYFRSTPTIQKQILGTKKQQLWQKLDDIRKNIDFIERQEDLIS